MTHSTPSFENPPKIIRALHHTGAISEPMKTNFEAHSLSAKQDNYRSPSQISMPQLLQLYIILPASFSTLKFSRNQTWHLQDMLTIKGLALKSSITPNMTKSITKKRFEEKNCLLNWKEKVMLIYIIIQKKTVINTYKKWKKNWHKNVRLNLS